MPTAKSNAVKKARELARTYMMTYGSCAQSAVMALQDVFVLESDEVLRAAASMTGGIGGMHDACGGLLGAAIMNGVVYGRDRTDMESKQRLHDAVTRTGQLYKWYEKQFGSATCYDIKKGFGNGVYFDSSVTWQAELARKEGVGDKCVNLVVETVAYMVEKVWDDVQAMKKSEKNR